MELTILTIQMLDAARSQEVSTPCSGTRDDHIYYRPRALRSVLSRKTYTDKLDGTIELI